MDNTPWDARLSRASAYSLYIHVPFCARKCAYCDFASWATKREDPLMHTYAEALVKQMGEAESIGLLNGVATGYIGGGTPSLLGADALGVLVGASSSLGVRELSCEANPDSLDDSVLDSLVSNGATRVSIGVQSLVDSELKTLGRLHDATLAMDRVRRAISCGLDVSCDLMCATPGQTDESWHDTLDAFLGLGAGHVSVYPLMIEEGTAFDRAYGDADCSWNSDEVQAKRMEIAQVKLEGNEFKRYEVASYAKNSKRCEHNIAYWTGEPYLGLGTQASSMLTLKGYMRLCAICKNLPSAPPDTARVRLKVLNARDEIASEPSLASLRFDIEFLTEAEAAAEDLMLGARLVDGLEPDLVEHAREVIGKPRVDDCLDSLLRRGLLRVRRGRLAPTHDGWLLGNELYGELWGLSPDEPIEACS